jgi:hypothetical protein
MPSPLAYLYGLGQGATSLGTSIMDLNAHLEACRDMTPQAQCAVVAIVGQGLLMLALLPLIDRSVNASTGSDRAFRRILR